MRKIREVLRLRLEADLSVRQISICTKVSVGSIQKLLKSAQALGLTWPLPTELDDGRLAALFYPQADTTISARHVVPDWPSVHQELKRKGSPNSCSGRSTPSAIPIAVTATPSSVTVTSPGVSCKSAPCARSTRRGKALYRLLRAHGAHRLALHG